MAMDFSDTTGTRAFGRLPLSNIVPFSYRDGATFADILYGLRDYVNNAVIPGFNETVNDAIIKFEDALIAAEKKFITAEGSWTTKFNAFMADVDKEIKTLNDSAFSDLINDGVSLTSRALRTSFVRRDEFVTNALDYQVAGVDTASWIELAIDSVPAHSVLTFPTALTISLNRPVNVDKPVILRGGKFKTSGIAFNVTSSDVTLDDVTIDGPGLDAVYLSKSAAINVAGNISKYLTNINIRNCVINGVRDTGIQAEYVKEFEIVNNTISVFKYAGIMMLSVEDGDCSYNIISDAYQAATQSNSYGIAVSDLINTVEGRSRNVNVTFNTVKNIPLWEGIDTHGGDNIFIAFNTVEECKNGIVATVGNNNRVTAPINCRIIANSVYAPILTTTTTTTGVALGGSAAANPLHPLYTDAIVALNTLSRVTIPVSLPTNTGDTVSRLRSIMQMNSGTGGIVVIDSDDTGWVPITKYGNFAEGYASNSSYPVMIRVMREGKGKVVKIEGAVSLVTSETRTNNIFFIFTDESIIPPYDKIMLGESRGVVAPYANAKLSVNTAGSFRTVFPADIYTTNFTVTSEYAL